MFGSEEMEEMKEEYEPPVVFDDEPQIGLEAQLQAVEITPDHILHPTYDKNDFDYEGNTFNSVEQYLLANMFQDNIPIF